MKRIKDLWRVCEDFISQFSELGKCEMKIVRIDFPTLVTEGYGADLVYYRKEYSDLNPSELYGNSSSRKK